MGDGALLEFASVVQAVTFSVEMQRSMTDRNKDVAREKRIDFRIGVNLGDVFVEEDDIFGEGVNVAARLEGLAEPGGIFISGTTYDHVKSKLDCGFEYLGEQQVKNIQEPVRVYKVLPEAKNALKAAASSGATSVRRKAASLAIRRFQIHCQRWCLVGLRRSLLRRSGDRLRAAAHTSGLGQRPVTRRTGRAELSGRAQSLQSGSTICFREAFARAARGCASTFRSSICRQASTFGPSTTNAAAKTSRPAATR